MSAWRSFSVSEPLRPGTTLVEASAGTGKTHGSVGLLLRLIAEEGLRIDEVLVVTFTKAATGELRDRVRSRLVEAIASIEGRHRSDDEVIACLSTGSPGEIALRLERLRRAREDFDLASISTIHGFCQRVLQTHAFESDATLGREMLNDTTPLVGEIVDDLLARELHGADERTAAMLIDDAEFTRASLGAMAATVVGAPDASILPGFSGDWRARFADWQREVAAFAEAWRTGAREATLKFLETSIDQKLLDGRLYQRKKTATCAASLDAWLDGARPPSRERVEKEAWIRYFSADQLGRAAKGAIAPTPVFAAWSTIVAGAVDLPELPRAEAAHRIRHELRARLQTRNQQSFDEVLRSLRDRLVDPSTSASLIAAIRGRYRAALVDEFQDTDAVQWTIFETLFAQDPKAFLYLIGDPKQAIYAFRGADVFVYDRARASTRDDRRRTMTVNQRSDGRFVDAMNATFEAPRVFDLDFIDYVKVTAAERHRDDRFRTPDDRAALRLRWLLPEESSKDRLRRRLTAAVADDVVELLSVGAEIASDGRWRAVDPRDIAILVQRHRQAEELKRALLDRGVPTIIGRTSSVLASEQATWIERWLAAIESPSRDDRLRALASTPLIGANAIAIAASRTDPDARWSAIVDVVVDGHATISERGVFAAFARLIDAEPVLERLSSRVDGERCLTNLRHLIELLHGVETRDRLAVDGLLQWLHQERGKAHSGAMATEETELRLESEADAVTIATVHASKGLQYPIVLAPYLAEGRGLSRNDRATLRFHDRDRDGALSIDLRADKHPEKRSHLEWAEREASQEALRLFYVALTRARHHAILYACPNEAYETSPLGAVLHGGLTEVAPDASRIDRASQRIEGAIKDRTSALLDDVDAWVARGRLADRATIDRSIIGVQTSGFRRFAATSSTAGEAATVRVFGADGLESSWRRVSYSALTRSRHAPREAEDHDAVAALDDRARKSSVERVVEVPLAAFPSGLAAGSFIHAVLEQLDFSTMTERAAPYRSVDVLVESLGRRAGVGDAASRALLAAQLGEVVRTPLGVRVENSCLADVGAADRLDELSFDLPLAGGDRFTRDTRPIDGRSIAAALSARLEDGGITRSYADELARVRLPDLAGFLTGGIDLVMRRHVANGESRWFVVDYKSNRLVDRDGMSTPLAYGRASMQAEMERYSYVLQAHLYAVALHRYLRWRVEGYDYDRHFGGVLYLFLRGMCGAETPRSGDDVQGVFSDRPPRAVIERLSDIFEGAR